MVASAAQVALGAPHPDSLPRQQPAVESGPGFQHGCSSLLATGSTPPRPRLRQSAPAGPLTKGRDDQGEASRKPGHFSHGRKTHQPLLQQAFQEMTRQNLPTHLGEDPFLFHHAHQFLARLFCAQLRFLG